MSEDAELVRTPFIVWLLTGLWFAIPPSVVWAIVDANEPASAKAVSIVVALFIWCVITAVVIEALE